MKPILGGHARKVIHYASECSWCNCV